MPVLLAGGRVTPAPDVPTVLKACQTPTDGLPGSPTVAIAIVTTPRFATGRTVELVVVTAELVLSDESLPKHAVAPSGSAASRPMSASRSRRTSGSACRGGRGLGYPRRGRETVGERV